MTIGRRNLTRGPVREVRLSKGGAMTEKEDQQMDAGKLLDEVAILRKRIQELESAEAEQRRLEVFAAGYRLPGN